MSDSRRLTTSEQAAAWEPSGTLRDKFINVLANANLNLGDDDIPLADVEALEAAGLIAYYDGWHITYDALALLLTMKGADAVLAAPPTRTSADGDNRDGSADQ